MFGMFLSNEKVIKIFMKFLTIFLTMFLLINEEEKNKYEFTIVHHNKIMYALFEKEIRLCFQQKRK